MKGIYIYTILLFFSSAPLFLSYGYYNTSPEIALRLGGGYCYYSFDIGAKTNISGLIKIDLKLDGNINVKEYYFNFFLDTKYIQLGLKYGIFYEMNLGYNIEGTASFLNIFTLNQYLLNQSFSFPGFSGQDYTLSLKLQLPSDFFRLGIGTDFLLVKFNNFSVVCNNETNEYDYIIYNNLTNADFQNYISENYFYDIFLTLFLDLYIPFNRNWGITLNSSFGFDFIGTQIAREELKKELEKSNFDPVIKDFLGNASISFLKMEIGLSFYYRIR